VFIEVRKHADA